MAAEAEGVRVERAHAGREYLMTRNVDSYEEALREVSKKHADIERVRALLEKSLKAGKPEAAYALGTWYLHGHNVKQDRRKAVRLLLQAAKGNVANALYDLAVCYEKGAGTKKNPKRAVECYLRAALHGDEKSVYEVGRCSFYGIGTTKDTKLAWAWLDRARELGVSSEPTEKPRAASRFGAGSSSPTTPPPAPLERRGRSRRRDRRRRRGGISFGRGR
jgi:hypothetical protein